MTEPPPTAEEAEEFTPEQKRLAAESLALLLPCKCGKPGEPGAECPYAAEIHNDVHECGCCEECQYQCAMDV